MSLPYSEVPVESPFKVHQGSKTLEEITEIAVGIWRRVQQAGPLSDAENDALLARLQSEEKDFYASYPLVLRWMVSTRKFSAHAFALYLRKCAHQKVSSKEEYLRQQAEYLVLLSCEGRRDVPQKERNDYREHLVKMLTREREEFEADEKKATELVDAEHQAICAERKVALLRMLLARRDAETSGGSSGVDEASRA